MAVKTIEWRADAVRMIDQRLLPAREVIRTYRDYRGVAEAIRTMVIRGAPAIGVAADDRKDFNWAMRTYDNGVDQIQPDGALPLEMARGARALHYHLYALAPLVLLAEFGEANRLDLYAHANGAIHRLVNFSVAGLKDPTPFATATGVQQEVPKTISGDQIGWAPPYAQRFPNPALEQMIEAAPSLSVYYLGGLPPGK